MVPLMKVAPTLFLDALFPDHGGPVKVVAWAMSRFVRDKQVWLLVLDDRGLYTITSPGRNRDLLLRSLCPFKTGEKTVLLHDSRLDTKVSSEVHSRFAHQWTTNMD